MRRGGGRVEVGVRRGGGDRRVDVRDCTKTRWSRDGKGWDVVSDCGGLRQSRLDRVFYQPRVFFAGIFLTAVFLFACTCRVFSSSFSSIRSKEKEFRYPTSSYRVVLLVLLEMW